MDDKPLKKLTGFSAGSIVSFAGEEAPIGWLLCNGQQCSSKDHPELYAAIGTKYTPLGSWPVGHIGVIFFNNVLYA